MEATKGSCRGYLGLYGGYVGVFKNPRVKRPY